MIRHLLTGLFFVLFFSNNAQCPQVRDYLGVLSPTPQFINCTGGVYALNINSNSSWGPYTINWGDGTPNHTGLAYIANSNVTHNYAATTATYNLTLIIPGLSCTLTGLVVQEQAALASIVVPNGVGSTLCAPKTLTFTNATTFTSATTSYTWHFGDGTPPQVFNSSNSGQNVTHLYNKGTVNCVTQVSLMAQNYCNFAPSVNSFGPLQVYDIDDAAITPDRVLKCWPDNSFTFGNTTQRNCLVQGNTSQRYEQWNFGNYFGMGGDSLIPWSPWPPSAARTITYPGLGTYTVSLQDSNICGIDNAVIMVSIVNSPTAALAAPGATACQNTAVTFSNTSPPGFSYRWNFGTGGGFVNLGGGNKTFTYTSPGTYTVRLVSLIPGAGGACTDTAFSVINILPSPVSSFSLNPSSGCDSIIGVTFTDLSTGAVTWNWSFANGVTSTLQAPPAQDYTTAALFTPTLLVTSSSGCSHSSTNTLIVRPRPDPGFIQFVACEGANVTFTNTSAVSGTNAISGYTWDPGNGLAFSNAQNPSYTYSVAGTYTVKLKAETAFCSDSLSLPIIINTQPTAGFAISPTVACPPMGVSFTNLSQNATNFYWDFGAAPNATANTTSGSYTYVNNTQAFVTFTVKLLASTAAGCIDSTTNILTVRPKPVAGFTTNAITGCSPFSVTFSNTSIGASTSAWSFGDGFFSQSANAVHAYTNTSLFTQTLTAQLIVTNSVSCSDTITQLITVYPEALTVFSMVPSSGCSPLVVNFPSVPGVAIYTWNHGDGSPTFTTLTAHTWTFVNNGNANQTFSVSLFAETSNSCTGTGSGSVTVFNNPVAGFSTTVQNGCTPLPVGLINNSTGAATYAWDFGNGQTSTLPNPASSFTNPPGAGPKDYSITLIARSNNNCADTVLQTVQVFAQPRAAFIPDTPACTPKLMKFKNTSAGAVAFSWDLGEGTTSALDTVQHLYVNNTPFDKTFNVRLTATNADNCQHSTVVPVTIHPKPEFFISALPDSGCSPLTVFFPKINGVNEYEWKYDNGISFGSAGDISNTFENKETGTRVFTVTLVARDQYKCSDTATRLIKVFPLPEARFSARPLSIFLPDQKVSFINESSPTATSYTWNFGDNNRSNEKSPEHLYTAPGEYQIILDVTSNFGCRDSYTLPENVVAIQETTIQIPNAFTPNPSGSRGTIFDPNDTSNDIFHPNVRGTEKYQFSIYSRWGELLFDTRNPNEGWDGYYRGKLCTQDVYIWKVNATFVDGKTYNKTGDVLLLK